MSDKKHEAQKKDDNKIPELNLDAFMNTKYFKAMIALNNPPKDAPRKVDARDVKASNNKEKGKDDKPAPAVAGPAASAAASPAAAAAPASASASASDTPPPGKK